jgi:hypothetical protein
MGMRITPAVGDDLETALRIMREDGHGVPNVTHLVSFEDEPLGCFSVAPSLFFYMRPDKASAIHSYKAFSKALDILREQSLMPVVSIETKSPYRPFLPKMGFEQLKGAELHICATRK